MRLTRDEQDMKDERDYREDVQRQVDDAAEARRLASGHSVDLYLVLEAANEGRKAGLWGYGASLNPHKEGSPEHDAWEKARHQVLAMRFNGRALRRMP